MSNHLQMALVETILSLRERGWSQRRIAKELGINRDTVSRYLESATDGSKPANAPPGSGDDSNPSKPANAPPGSADDPAESKPANAPPGSSVSAKPRRTSQCEPWRAIITTLFEQGLSGQRIHQDLMAEHGFTGNYYAVRRFINHLEEHFELPFRRMETGPGEEAQIDFGTGASLLLPDGKRRRTHVFRVVLGYSRKAYSEVVLRQTTEAFLRCLENAFWHFGGVPRRLILDNLRAAVTKADWYEPELNPKIEAFARHYGAVFLPTRPRMPRHKGKVEKGIDYVQDNALKGRTFSCLEEQNRHLAHWEETIADRRIHGTTRRQVGAQFAEVEKATLQKLPIDHFPCFQEAQRSVHRDGHVEVERAYYSVPPEYLGRRVWARWDGRVVRVFNQKFEQIAVHSQREAGRFATLDEHIASEKINAVERGSTWLLGQIRRIGTHSLRWAEAMLAERGIEGLRVLQGLLSLTKKHRGDDIEHACDIALSHGAFRLRTLRALIEREAPKQSQLDFTEEHEVIRPLVEYGRLLDDLFPKGETE
jgi:transposase